MNDPQQHDTATQLKLLSREMVHKLNNMLFIIDGYSQFIKETLPDEESLDNIRHIEIAAKKSQQIMADWRIEADKLVPDPPGT
jgi:light-regulated signal transduction histidine kinase (bacteriophytochrome)